MGATLLPLNLTASLCVTYSPDFRRRNECSAGGVPECNRVTVCNLFSPDYRRRNECSVGGVPECDRVTVCNLFSTDYRRRNECSAGGVPECTAILFFYTAINVHFIIDKFYD